VFNNVTLISDPTDPHFTYEVLHEFGHVLGWAHEQQRPDNWTLGTQRGNEIYCKNPVQANPLNGTYRTSYFDLESVMSYCMEVSKALSPGDVAGVQSAYGVAGPLAPIWRSQNSSSNAVSRNPGQLDTFFVHSDGKVWTSYWSSGMTGPWPTWPIAGATGVPSDAPLAAVARTPYNLDVFFVGNDGAVHDAAWWDGAQWGTFTLPGTAGLARAGEQVAAVSSSPGAIDVIFAGTNGNLYWSRGWSGNTLTGTIQSGWNNPVAVVADNSVPAGAAVTAVARWADVLDAFYVGKDGALHTAYCSGTLGAPCTPTGWRRYTTPLGPGCLAQPGAGVAATARSGNQLDVFYTDVGGAICNSWWTPNTGWKAYRIGFAAPPGGQITAVSRLPSVIDLFWAGGDDGFDTAWWIDGASSWGARSLGSGFFYPGDPLGVTARTPNNLDVFGQSFVPFFHTTDGLENGYWWAGIPWATYQADAY
jgi:hypothetical protein